MKYTPIALKLASRYLPKDVFEHSLRVADIAIQSHGGLLDTDRLFATALLHDLFEDANICADWVEREIGNKEILDDLYTLTRYKAIETYHEYIVKVSERGSLYALRIKQADIKDHLMQHETLKPSLKERYLKALPYLI